MTDTLTLSTLSYYDIYAEGRRIYNGNGYADFQHQNGIVARCWFDNGELTGGMLLHDGEPMPQRDED